MKPFLLLSVFAFVFSGCHLRFVEGTDSPYAKYVGRHAEVRQKIAIYDQGFSGRLGIPVGEWPMSKGAKISLTIEPGTGIEIIGVSSRKTESGKHYYLTCRHRIDGKEVIFDYPANAKFIGADYLSWL